MSRFFARRAFVLTSTLAALGAFALSGCGASPYAEGDAATTASAATAVASTQDPALYEVNHYMSADAKGPVGPEVGDHSSPEGKITVAVTVDTTAVAGTILKSDTQVVLDEGATALDALKQVMGDEAVNVQNSQYGAYVAAIGNVAQQEHGNASSWMFDVNGTVGAVTADQLKLNDGDSLVWFYVTGDM